MPGSRWRFFGNLIVKWLRRDADLVPPERPLATSFNAEEVYYKEFTREKKRLNKRRGARGLPIPQGWDSDDDV